MAYRLASLFLLTLFSSATTLASEPSSENKIAVVPSDWPWWRGPNRNGIAAVGQRPPLVWSETKNVLWKSPVPGRGHSSPTVVGDHIYLQTAVEENETQSVLCYNRTSGENVWKTDVHREGFDRGSHVKNSQASSTIACDGTLLFVNFFHNKAIYTTALSLKGEKRWQRKISDFVTHQGYAASPALYQSLVIVSADNKGEGRIVAMDRESGRVVWEQKRPPVPNYTSPVILRVGNRDQMLLSGCDLVSSFHPLSGKKLWETKGSTTECVTTMVTDGKIVFTSGGYPENHLLAVRADTQEVAWRNSTRIYVPSMLVHEGYLYSVTDAGVATCWNCETGKSSWKERLGGTCNASLVLAAGHIFATNENGQTFVFKANPEKFEKVAENKLGDEVFPTAAICGSRVYMRVAKKKGGERQEFLYCLAAR